MVDEQAFGDAVQFIAMDAQADQQLNMRYGVGGYPTVLCFSKGLVEKHNTILRFFSDPSFCDLAALVWIRGRAHTAAATSTNAAMLARGRAGQGALARSGIA